MFRRKTNLKPVRMYVFRNLLICRSEVVMSSICIPERRYAILLSSCVWFMVTFVVVFGVLTVSYHCFCCLQPSYPHITSISQLTARFSALSMLFSQSSTSFLNITSSGSQCLAKHRLTGSRNTMGSLSLWLTLANCIKPGSFWRSVTSWQIWLRKISGIEGSS